MQTGDVLLCCQHNHKGSESWLVDIFLSNPQSRNACGYGPQRPIVFRQTTTERDICVGDFPDPQDGLVGKLGVTQKRRTRITQKTHSLYRR